MPDIAPSSRKLQFNEVLEYVQAVYEGSEPVRQRRRSAPQRPEDEPQSSRNCPSCGAPAPDGAVFCAHCGEIIAGAGTATAESGRLNEYSRDQPVGDAPPGVPAAPSAQVGQTRPRTLERMRDRATRWRERVTGKKLGRDSTPKEWFAAIDESFSSALLRRIDESPWTEAEVYKRAHLTRQHFSKIRSNNAYRPSKQTAVSLAIALELPLEEANGLLAKAGHTLSRSFVSDVVVEYYITQGVYDLFEINDVLYQLGESLLS